jgi:hypothetical protein
VIAGQLAEDLGTSWLIVQAPDEPGKRGKHALSLRCHARREKRPAIGIRREKPRIEILHCGRSLGHQAAKGFFY